MTGRGLGEVPRVELEARVLTAHALLRRWIVGLQPVGDYTLRDDTKAAVAPPTPRQRREHTRRGVVHPARYRRSWSHRSHRLGGEVGPMNICQQLGACAYDVVEGGDTSEPCQWWSDCFGQSNPLPFTMGTTDTEGLG